ncbi:MAG TPA: hypothetical protein VFE51_19590 [Verrucomicrobiae bacterium]|nr:hypothetical protein [Verrucomicrobiae bacterium]
MKGKGEKTVSARLLLLSICVAFALEFAGCKGGTGGETSTEPAAGAAGGTNAATTNASASADTNSSSASTTQ